MKKILVVDDNDQNLYMLKILLEGNGYQITLVKNGNEALEAAHSNTPDLIISDILMPGMDGFALCRECKKDSQLKDIPFIFYTATYTDPKDEQFALSLGAVRFIRKPSEPDQFIRIVKNELDTYKKGTIIQPNKPITEEKIYYKEYNATLIRKMETKLLELDRTNQRLSTLFQASIDMVSLKPVSELVPFTMKKIVDLLSCDFANYFNFDENKKELYLQTAVGYSERDLEGLRKKLKFSLGEGQGPVGLVGQTQEPLIINDVLSDPRWIKFDDSIKSALFLPLVCEKRLIGVISILSTRTGNFDKNCLRDVTTLTNNIAVAIDKANLHEKTKKSENRYRTFMEGSIDAIISFDNTGLITDWSRGAEEIFGYSKDEVLNKNIHILTPPQFEQQWLEAMKETREKGYKRVWESQRIAKANHLVEVEVSITYLDSDQSYICIFRDITDRKRAAAAEEKLAKEAIRSQILIEQSRDGIVVLDENGGVYEANLRFAEMLGYSREEISKLHVWDWDFKLPKEQLITMIHDIDEKGDHFETQHKRKGGSILDVEISTNASIFGGQKLIFCVCRDITDRKRKDVLLNALNQATAAMGAVQTRQEIFDAIANELKQLDIFCFLFPLDETQEKLFTNYISYDSSLLSAIEKLLGIKYENFSFPIDPVDLYREVIREEKVLFTDNLRQIFQQIFTKISKKNLETISKLIHIQNSISAPLIAEGKVIGVFSVQSDSLTPKDIPAATAFANQLAGAWNRTIILEDLKNSLEGTIRTLAATVEVRDPYTAGHQARVANLAIAIAKELQLSEFQIEGVRMSASIHDLGKIQVPAEVLSKPGKLSEIEFNLIKAHPRIGYDLLRDIKFPWPITTIILQHHEKMDGSGYPQGLKGDEILLESRILAVADIVEAMSSHRPYRPALGIEKALEQIKKDRGTLLDPDAVDACLKIFEEGFQLPVD